MKEPLLPSPFNLFFCLRSNFRAKTRLETLATQANSNEVKFFGLVYQKVRLSIIEKAIRLTDIN